MPAKHLCNYSSRIPAHSTQYSHESDFPTAKELMELMKTKTCNTLREFLCKTKDVKAETTRTRKQRDVVCRVQKYRTILKFMLISPSSLSELSCVVLTEQRNSINKYIST